jgi:hypothetical protein
MSLKNLINYLGVIFVCVIIFAFGFYFGYKNSESKNTLKQTTGSTSIVKSSSNSSQSSTSTTQPEIIQTSEVFWIKPGQDKICPSDHPIKGTFQPDMGNYYTKDNPRYDRTKPDICFSNENYAQNQAGFIKKF